MKNINANALVAFSIGQDTAKGQILRDDIELASKLYGSITLLAGDSLQRYTKMIIDSCSMEDGYQRSLMQGNNWLLEVESICAELNIKCNIVRWDELINRKDFEACLTRINDMYDSGKFKTAARKSVGKFIRRYQDKGIITQDKAKQAFDICLKYVKEECAVFLMLGGQYTHLQYHYPLGEAIEHVCGLANIETVEAAKVHKQLLKPAVSVYQGAFFRFSSSPMISPVPSPEREISPPSSPEQESAMLFYGMLKAQVDTFMRGLNPNIKDAVAAQLAFDLQKQISSKGKGFCYN